MKTLKTLLSVFAIAAVFSAGAYAQIFDNADITATTSVVSSISAGNTGNLNFGTILNTGTPSIAADSSAAGYVQFTGATIGATVDIDVTYPGQLSPQGSGTGFFTFTASNLGIDEFSGASPNSPTVQGVSTGYSHTVASNGTDSNFFVTVGGSLSPSGGPSPSDDTYSGTITVTASYQ